MMTAYILVLTLSIVIILIAAYFYKLDQEIIKFLKEENKKQEEYKEALKESRKMYIDQYVSQQKYITNLLEIRKILEKEINELNAKVKQYEQFGTFDGCLESEGE